MPLELPLNATEFLAQKHLGELISMPIFSAPVGI